MMEGTYYKERSAVLDREMEFKVYGHGGVPVLALPARGGRFYDWENNGMPDAAARLLHEGKIPAMKIGRSYRIPKAHLFTYLQICGQHCRAENRQC